MAEIGIRELKVRTSEIIKSVRERHARYVITHRGRPVGILLPIEDSRSEASGQGETAWAELLRLGKAIGRRWKEPETSTELLSSMRR